MREDKMDESIRELARRTYNAPPEPPRDELWQRIRADLAARRAARPDALEAGTATEPKSAIPLALLPSTATFGEPSADGARPGVIDLAARRRRATRWALRALPIAALLVLSFGLGRLTHFWEPRGTRPVAVGGATASPAARTPAEPTGPAPAAAPSAPAFAPRQPAMNAGAAASAPGAAPRLLADRSAGGRVGRAGARTTLYRFAAEQTLGQAEMLLTSFRAEARAGGTIDPQVTSWAGDVLSSTRLLLDSPAARDPRLRGLLEDLELVLAQIVQLGVTPPDARSGDTDLIDHALQQRDLMLRLRTAVPAGAVGT